MPIPVVLEEERIWKESENHRGDGFGGTRTVLSVKIQYRVAITFVLRSVSFLSHLGQNATHILQDAVAY